MGADSLDGRADLRLCVDREVVEHHDVARAQRRNQDLLDIGAEGGIVDRSVEDRPVSRRRCFIASTQARLT
jgi:hypothetical protein